MNTWTWTKWTIIAALLLASCRGGGDDDAPFTMWGSFSLTQMELLDDGCQQMSTMEPQLAIAIALNDIDFDQPGAGVYAWEVEAFTETCEVMFGIVEVIDDGDLEELFIEADVWCGQENCRSTYEYLGR